MTYIQTVKQNEITLLTLNRADKHNAFNYDLLLELQQTLIELQKDSQTRLLIMTGAGEKSFSSGVDLMELVKFKTIEEARNFALQLEETMMELLRFSKHVIAAINGYAFGGGYGLASNADVRIMVNSAKIGFPAVRLGAILPVGCTLRLSAIIGSGHSRELLLSGRIVDAEEAQRIGLVNQITRPEVLLEEAYKVAEEILRGSDSALAMTKQMTNQELISQIQQYSVSAAENFAYLAFTDDWKKRITRFINNKTSKN